MIFAVVVLELLTNFQSDYRLAIGVVKGKWV